MANQPSDSQQQRIITEELLKKNFSDAGDLRRERAPAPAPVENKVPPSPAQDNSPPK